MKWLQPPAIKVYEALGCIADERLEITENTGKVYSSSKGKFYEIIYDPDTNKIMCNDNGSYYRGYLGYPAIALLMRKGILLFDETYANALKGIKWKDLNQKHKNDFSKTLEHIHNGMRLQGISVEGCEAFAEKVLKQIQELSLELLGEKTLPPKGY